MRIIYETERVAKLRELIRRLDAKELDFLKEYIERERENRKREVYSEWLEYVESKFLKSFH